MSKSSFTEFPLGLAGQIFGSAMPYGLYDPDGHLFGELKKSTVSTVVLLAELDECKVNTGRDLIALYQQEGVAVLPLSTPNYGVPPLEPLAQTLTETIARAAQGQNILVHCSAGIGRTALIAALLVKKVLSLSGAEAIEWLVRCKPDALLTPAQIVLILT